MLNSSSFLCSDLACARPIEIELAPNKVVAGASLEDGSYHGCSASIEAFEGRIVKGDTVFMTGRQEEEAKPSKKCKREW